MEDNKGNTRQKNPIQTLHIVLIFFCFIAGFLGAATLLQIGIIKPGNPTATPKSQQKIVAAEGEVIAATYKKVVPSVVSITTKAVDTSSTLGAVYEGAGTGIIISSDGYIVTNNHVTKDARNISVVTNDGSIYKDVDYIGSDPLNDIAFLKIKGAAKPFKAAALADSSTVQVGQKVIAIGNALGQYQNSVTSGIISGQGRPVIAQDGQSDEQLDNLFQTDAAINPGNSGGPLLNLNGEVIGINTAIAQDSQGIGFAIPINAAKGLIKSVLSSHVIKKSYLGVRYLTITPQVADSFGLPVKKGAYIYDDATKGVIPGSPADKAGLRDKDIITKVNNQAVDENNGLALLLAPFVPGDNVSLTILRDDSSKTIEVTLGEYTAP